MTVILVLLCLAIAGRELYLAFDRRRTGTAPEVADIRTQLRTLKGTRDELQRFRTSQHEKLERLVTAQDEQGAALRRADARVDALITDINDRMLPEVNARLAGLTDDLARLSRRDDPVERLSAEIARLRGHLVGQLERQEAASLGADPVDTIGGRLGGNATRRDLVRAYERFAERYGLRVELTDPEPGEGGGDWRVRYYLSGRSPRALERDFIDLVRMLRAVRGDSAVSEEGTDARTLLACLCKARTGGAQVGPFVAVRTPESLLCGVLPLSALNRREASALLTDPSGTAVRLRRLPETRLCDVSSWPALLGRGGPGGGGRAAL
ncbi:hypothetical protein [Spirillospora sp. CA-294931]|uniref:hypothetical protein n=1 Tax=Spirillospora sp. CA-294931 TaxID=3240042 RepID=UPI003D917EA5